MRKRKRIFGNKKGSLIDIMYYAGLITFLAVSILIGFRIAGQFNAEVQTNPDFDSHARNASSTLVGYYPGIIDNTFLFVTIGIGLATLVLAAMVRVHPIFIPIFFIGLIIVIFFSAILSNVYAEFASNPTLAAEANQLVKVAFVLDLLPFIIGIFGILLMMVMYKLWSVSQ